MGQIPFAAFDPIFWAHHTMIDRLWRLWQLAHPHAPCPPALLDDALPPFRMTVRADARRRPRSATTTPRATRSAAVGRSADRFVANRSNCPTHELGEAFSRADLIFYGVDHSGPSYEARVFLNNPERASRDTPRDPAAGYAGSFTVFGHGGCFGDDGHCDVPSGPDAFDLRPPHPLTPYTRTLILPREAVEALSGDSVTVTLVAVEPGREEGRGERRAQPHPGAARRLPALSPGAAAFALRVPGTAVPGTACQLCGARHEVPGKRGQARGARYPVPGTQCQARHARHRHVSARACRFRARSATGRRTPPRSGRGSGPACGRRRSSRADARRR